jgi:hypothetical protein
MFSKNNTQRSSRRRSRSHSHSRSRSLSPPPKVNKIEPQINKNNGNSFTDSIVSGFGFGVGSSIAHKMTDSIFTKTNNNDTTNDNNNNEKNIVCNELKTQLNICVTESNSDCKNLYDNFFNNCK